MLLSVLPYHRYAVAIALSCAVWHQYASLCSSMHQRYCHIRLSAVGCSWAWST